MILKLLMSCCLVLPLHAFIAPVATIPVGIPALGTTLSRAEPLVGFGGGQWKAQSHPVCGPSMAHNTFTCLDLNQLSNTKNYSIWGSLSSTPVFDKETLSWFFSTTEGLVLRYQADPQTGFPIPRVDTLPAWGFYERRELIEFRNFIKTKKEDFATWSLARDEVVIASAITPTVLGLLTQNHKLSAVELTTGKVLWSKNLATNKKLYLDSRSLAFQDGLLFVGNSYGEVIGYEPESGVAKTELKMQRKSYFGQANYATSIVAPPLFTENSLIVSNVVDSTQKISLTDGRVIWSIGSEKKPQGSSTSPIAFESTVVLGLSSGVIEGVELETGNSLWRFEKHKSPVHQLVKLASSKVLAVWSSGAMSLFDIKTGKIEDQSQLSVKPLGNIFAKSESEFCFYSRSFLFQCFKLM